MALKGCYGRLKWLFLGINLILFAASTVIVVWDVWELVQVERSNDFPVCVVKQVYDELLWKVCIIIYSFLGCWGAYRENQRLLGIFFVFLMVVLVVQTIDSVWVYQNRDELEKTIRDSVRDTVTKDYLPDPSPENEAFDAIQQEYKCCGSDGPQSWDQSAYNGNKSELGNVGYQLPPSCCVEPNSTACEYARKVKVGPTGDSFDNTVIYIQGCSDALIKAEHNSVIRGIEIMIMVICVLQIIFSMLLLRAIRKTNDFKASNGQQPETVTSTEITVPVHDQERNPDHDQEHNPVHDPDHD